jgi:hypothetical protein
MTPSFNGGKAAPKKKAASSAYTTDKHSKRKK